MSLAQTFHRLAQPLRQLALACSLGVVMCISARADDLDIYTTPLTVPAQAPLTVLSLDLNLTNPTAVVCDNVLLRGASGSDCLAIQERVTLADLAALLNPGAPLPLSPLAILGGLNPNVLLSDLLNTVSGPVLAGVLGLAGNVLALSQQQAYAIALQQILSSLVDTRLAIMLNHANRGPRPPTVPPALPAPPSVCAFPDRSSMPAPRNTATACSNGAYLFLGLTNLVDFSGFNTLQGLLVDPTNVDLARFVTRVTAGLLPSITGLATLGLTNPYQPKEVYAELIAYLRGDPIYNGHLGFFDYGDENPNNNLNASLPALSWDPAAEQAGNTRYVVGLNRFPQACNINLLHLQVTNAVGQDDSDELLATQLPEADADGNGTLTLNEVVRSAEENGFAFGDDRRRIRSRFVVQENLFTNGDLSDLDRINDLGGNVTTYSNVLGLLGRGTDLAGSLNEPLSVDASIGSLAITASRTERNGRLNSAFLPIFRADPDLKPDWPGNVKRLQLRDRAGDARRFDVVDARNTTGTPVVSAIDGEGRIRSNALTFWTDPTRLGAGVTSDGMVADRGGAGQNIPGFQFGGGGNPGRSNGGTGRTIYYDSQRCTNGNVNNVLCRDLSTAGQPGKLHPDDSAVRAELLAATGAVAVTLPDPNCNSNCTNQRNARDAVCNDLISHIAACDAEEAACRASCNSADSTAVCDAEQASCISACNANFPGALNFLARTTCITGCNTTRLTCPVTRLAQCTAQCPVQRLLCPGVRQAQCLADSAVTFAGCLATCQVTRSADTVVRELLLYARGFDVGTRASPAGDRAANPTSPTNTGISGRPWMLGAVLHSKPLAINYGRRIAGSNTDDVRVVFGSAGGLLHMVNDRDGAESWAFMPQATMGSLAALRENAPGTPLPYGVDGQPLVLIRDRAPPGGVRGTIGDVTAVADNPATAVDETVLPDRVLLFFGLRRGGSAYYAMDITDPDAPRLLWRIDTSGLLRAGEAAPVTGSAAQFAGLGLAFSTPQVARLRVDVSGVVQDANADVATRTVLVFGGGYNGGRNTAGVRLGKDFNNSRNAIPGQRVGRDDGTGATRAADRGNALFMVDAATGELIWRAVRSTDSTASYEAASLSYRHPMMVDSIPSEVTVVDTDNDTFTDRLYVGDTGGRLWRADFASTLPSQWTVTPLASVGRHATNNVENDRRIFFAPDYVPIRSTVSRNGIDLVLFGTGDREDPFNLTTRNDFFALRDDDLISGRTPAQIITTENDDALAQLADFNDVTNTPSGDLGDISAMPTGYRFTYPRSGEKHFSAPVTLGGTTTFTTYVPPDPTAAGARICTPSEGVSRLFTIGVRKSEFRNVVAQSAGRDVPLGTGLPGDINVLSGTQQAAGGRLLSIPARDFYRASWRERLGETQK